jgi:hypothetical protein
VIGHMGVAINICEQPQYSEHENYCEPSVTEICL